MPPPIWRQLWPQSDFPIIPIRRLHLLSTFFSSPDVPTSMIWCGPGGLGVYRVNSEGEIYSYEVEKLVMHLVMSLNDKPSLSVGKYMTYIKGLRSTITFLKFRGKTLECAHKKLWNSMAGSTVRVTVVPRRVRQQPVCLTRRNMQRSRMSRLLISTSSME